MKIAAVIVAAGRGTRAGGTLPKQWQMLGSKRVIDHTIERFLKHEKIQRVIVVLHADDVDMIKRNDVSIAIGGDSRAVSVFNGLLHLNDNNAPDVVLIHDGARATTPISVINRVIDELSNSKAVAPALPVSDALWIVKDNQVEESQDRSNLWRAQTPQGFDYKTILNSYIANQNHNFAADDVEVASLSGHKAQVVQGHHDNIKITTADDFTRALRILGED